MKNKNSFSYDSLERLLLIIVFLEFCWILLSGISMSALYQNTFFKIGVDPVYWFLYLLKIPQYITGHHWLGIAIDGTILLLLASLIVNGFNTFIARTLFICLLIFYVTLTGYLAHRNYQIGFVMVLFPFMFRKESKPFAFEALRYFVLFFYFSSAVFKILQECFTDPQLLSSFLKTQFTPYFLENHTGWRTDMNLFLIQHTQWSYILYVSVMLIEGIAVIGFFTKKWDKQLVAILLLFHLCNWIVMDIAPIGHIAFICSIYIAGYCGTRPEPQTTAPL